MRRENTVNRFEPIAPPANEPDTRTAAAWIGALATELAAAEAARREALESMADMAALVAEYDAECDEGYCQDCNGSGEGSYDGSRCATCHGWGETGHFISDDYEDAQ